MIIKETQDKKGYFKLNNVYYKKEWLDAKQIWIDNKEWVKVVILIGENSIGKTYSVENLFAEFIKQKKNVVWIRNTEKQANTCVNGWMNTLIRHKLDVDYQIDKSGIYETPKVEKSKKGIYFNKNIRKLVCPFVYLSSPDNSIPQIEDCHMYCIDEFLSGNEKGKFSMKNPLYIIRQMMKRTVRDFASIKPCLFLIANPHNELESDVLADLDIYPNENLLFENKDEIWFDRERGIIYVSILDLSDWDNDRLREQDSFFTSFMNKETNYSFMNPKKKRIKKAPEDLNYIYKLSSLNLNKKVDTCVFCEDTEHNYWIIKEKNKHYNLSIPNFSFDFKTSNNEGVVYIGNDRVKSKQILSPLFNAIIKNKLYYDCVWSEQFIILWKQYLSTLINRFTDDNSVIKI